MRLQRGNQVHNQFKKLLKLPKHYYFGTMCFIDMQFKFFFAFLDFTLSRDLANNSQQTIICVL